MNLMNDVPENEFVRDILAFIDSWRNELLTIKTALNNYGII